MRSVFKQFKKLDMDWKDLYQAVSHASHLAMHNTLAMIDPVSVNVESSICRELGGFNVHR